MAGGSQTAAELAKLRMVRGSAIKLGESLSGDEMELNEDSEASCRSGYCAECH